MVDLYYSIGEADIYLTKQLVNRNILICLAKRIVKYLLNLIFGQLIIWNSGQLGNGCFTALQIFILFVGSIWLPRH